jgi:predicted nucleotidyltransferase
MPPTRHAEVNALLPELLSRFRALFGDWLAGVCLWGSAVAGDFEPGASDVDLLVVTGSDVEARQLREIGRMHDDFAREHPEWTDRIDAVYASTTALQAFRSHSSPVAVISRGEPLHTTETDESWILKWYLVREQGVALLGPSPRDLIGPVSGDEFVASVRAHLREWPRWILASQEPGFHAYAVVTLCRALYACTHRAQLSKRQAALWFAREHPEWAALIGDALAWRSEPATELRAEGFIDFVLREVGALQFRSPL